VGVFAVRVAVRHLWRYESHFPPIPSAIPGGVPQSIRYGHPELFLAPSGPVPARRIFFALGIDFRLELYYLINVDSKNSRSLFVHERR